MRCGSPRANRRRSRVADDAPPTRQGSVVTASWRPAERSLPQDKRRDVRERLVVRSARQRGQASGELSRRFEPSSCCRNLFEQAAHSATGWLEQYLKRSVRRFWRVLPLKEWVECMQWALETDADDDEADDEEEVVGFQIICAACREKERGVRAT